MKRARVPVSLKCPAGVIDFIDRDIEENAEFKDRTEWMNAAFRFFIEHREAILNERKAKESIDFGVSSENRAEAK